jgi:tetratricopeptide (TPR) repeat protein
MERVLSEIPAALEHTQRGLRIRLQAFGPADRRVAESYHQLGYVHFRRGRMAAAREVLDTALRLREDLFGRVNHGVGETLKLIGSVHNVVGELAVAKAVLEEAVAILAECDGADSIDTVAAENELADVDRRLKLHAESAARFEHVLEVRRARHGTHPYVAGTLVRWSALLHDTGQLSEAEDAVRQGIAMLEETLGAENMFVAEALSQLGLIQHSGGELAAATETLESAVGMCERTCKEHPYLADALHRLALVRRELGDLESARALASRARAVREICLSRSPADTG